MYYFIINPKSRSGRGKQIWNLVKQELDELQIPYKFFYTEHKYHATEITTQLCENAKDQLQLVVLGGDGTVNEVINGITDFTKVCLSYIPSGSSNDFARSLRISGKPKTALSTALNPERQIKVDIGELEVLDAEGNITSTRKFAVSSGIGYDAAICYEALNSKLKDRLNALHLGKLTYGLIAIKEILKYRKNSGELMIDGNEKKHFDDIIFLVSMIHKYEGGGAQLAPQADYADKKLSVCFVHNFPRWKVLLLLPTAFIAKHTIFKGVEIFDCSQLELTLDSAKVTHSDGEFSGDNRRIRVRCDRHSLLINAPL